MRTGSTKPRDILTTTKDYGYDSFAMHRNFPTPNELS